MAREQKCPFCDETFTEAKAMADHINQEHSDGV